MMTPDLINGSFEFIGGCLIWLSVRRLYKDKQVKGVSILPVTFFAGWGFWNLYYYPHLHQLVSFVGGINVVVANTVWVAQMLYYRRSEPAKLLSFTRTSATEGLSNGTYAKDETT